MKMKVPSKYWLPRETARKSSSKFCQKKQNPTQTELLLISSPLTGNSGAKCIKNFIKLSNTNIFHINRWSCKFGYEVFHIPLLRAFKGCSKYNFQKQQECVSLILNFQGSPVNTLLNLHIIHPSIFSINMMTTSTGHQNPLAPLFTNYGLVAKT